MNQQTAYARAGSGSGGYWDMYAAAQKHRSDWIYQQHHNQYEIGASIRRAVRDGRLQKDEASRLRWMMNAWGGGGAFPGFDSEGVWIQLRPFGEAYYGPDAE